MARINLLPWREELRRLKRKQYLTTLGLCAVLALAIWGAWRWKVSEDIKHQKSRNETLAAEIRKLDKQIEEIRELEREKERLISRMKAIESLQTSRPIIVHIFDELVDSLPEGVYLRGITQKGKKIEIRGIAQSNARVSNFMRNVENSVWLKNPKLDVIQTGSEDGRRTANFTLRVEEGAPPAEDSAAEEGEA